MAIDGVNAGAAAAIEPLKQAPAPAAGAAVPQASPRGKGDQLTVSQPAGRGVPAVSFVTQEEPNRKAGVTFKNMLKAAKAADDDGLTKSAVPLFDRAINLAEDSGDLEKVIKAADNQAYLPVVERALAKGLKVTSDVGDLLSLAKLADKRGLTRSTEGLLHKAISNSGNAKELRKLAEFASDNKLVPLAQAAFNKIANLPAKK